jgi:two-component system, chemotaxis family, sensor kinase CheA
MSEFNEQTILKEIREKVQQWSAARKMDFYVMCVDDESDILEILSEIVQSAGFKCVTFTNPLDAVAWYKDNAWRLALVISDFNMPEMDGFAFNRALPRVPPVPFVILSAHVDKETALKAIECKIVAFLSKPSAHGEIAQLLQKEALARANIINEEQELLQGFLDDAKGLVEQIEPLVLGLGSNPNDREALNSLFGMVHTIKGASGFFEPKILHNFAHKFEDKLNAMRSGATAVSGAAVGMMLKATDVLRQLLGEMESRKHISLDVAPLLACLETGEQDGSAEIAGTAAVGEGGQGGAKAPPKTSELKVDVSLIDEFIQASGEMTVMRTMITKSVQAIEKSYRSDRDVQMLGELLEEFHKINASVQSRISELRKVPVRTVIRSFPRIVRDVSKQLGKKVNLVVEGDDMRVDTAVIDALSKSMVHLVRNSLDHGLEAPEDRGGKDPTGTIRIRAYTKDEHVYVEVSDDGRGINTARVKEKARTMNLYSQQELDAMSPEQIHLLIFEAGFSTAAQVTDLSGRGVGMSVVKESVEALGGKIVIETEAGKGAIFRLVIPVPKSVLIKNSLFVSVCGGVFAIPHDQIVRVIHDPEIEDLHGRPYFRLGGELLPVARLDLLFGEEADAAATTYIIVKTAAGVPYAIPIREVHEFEDAVIKPVEAFVKQAGVFAGATFLGDGSVGLVLDLDGVAEATGMQAEKVQTSAAKDEKQEQATTDSHSNDFLLFDLSDELPYAIPLRSLLRIEEFKFDETEEASAWRKVPYRDGVLHILDVQSALGEKAPTGSSRHAPVLVVDVKGHKFGLKIGLVREFFASEKEMIPAPTAQTGVLGNLIYQERTLTVLDPELLVRKMLGANAGYLDENAGVA